MKKKFVRRCARRHSKLGKGRRKKQKWRKPKGRDNKMREKVKSRPPVVSVGYRKAKDERGKINGKNVVRVENLKDVEKVKKEDAVIIAKVGRKKREEIEKKLPKDVEILNKKKEKSKAEKENKSQGNKEENKK